MLLQWLANGKINPQKVNDAITKLTHVERLIHRIQRCAPGTKKLTWGMNVWISKVCFDRHHVKPRVKR